MEKLRDILGTRYIYDDFQAKLREVLESVDEVDLAGCKFTPKCEKVLSKFYSSVYMVNTEDENLNRLLIYNMVSAKKPVINAKPLPSEFKELADIVRVCKSLDHSVVYSMPEIPARRKAFASVAVIAMVFPDVKLSLGSNIKELFDFVRMEWLKYRDTHNKYWCIDNSAIVEIEIVDGTAKLMDGTELTEEQLVLNYCVLPYEFGVEQTFKNPEFEGVVDECLRILNITQPEGRKMIDYIERF